MFAPEVRWLNQQDDRLLIVDSENFSFYQVDDINEPSTSNTTFMGYNQVLSVTKSDQVVISVKKENIYRIICAASIWITLLTTI